MFDWIKKFKHILALFRPLFNCDDESHYLKRGKFITHFRSLVFFPGGMKLFKNDVRNGTFSSALSLITETGTCVIKWRTVDHFKYFWLIKKTDTKLVRYQKKFQHEKVRHFCVYLTLIYFLSYNLSTKE